MKPTLERNFEDTGATTTALTGRERDGEDSLLERVTTADNGAPPESEERPAKVKRPAKGMIRPNSRCSKTLRQNACGGLLIGGRLC
jgi:hypothetical protein